MGSGQPNRVKSVQIALEKAKEEVKVRLMPYLCSLHSEKCVHHSLSTGHAFAWCMARCGLARLLVPRLATIGTCICTCTTDVPQPQLLQGSVLASDAFFPFSWNDSVEIACQVGGVGMN